MASMLAAVVLLIIATGIETQLRAFNAGRSHVQETQIARVLLHRIGDDLRALMPPGEATGSAHAAASNEESDESEGSDLDSESEPEDDEDDAIDDEATMGESTLNESMLSGTTPGVYGGLDWLRFDIIRAKRLAGSSSDELPSDDAMPQAAGEIETIVYYVLTPEELAVEAVSTNSDQTGGGLVRRELVRPTAAWAAETGSMEYRDTAVSPIAPEVTAVEFRYHDGSEWLESWDSSSSGTLPKAFEIRLFLARQIPTNSNPPEATGETSDERDDLSSVQYRLIVPVMLQGQSAGKSAIKGTGEAESETEDEGEPQDESSESSASSDNVEKSDSSGGER